MATATFVHDANSVDHTPGSDVAAGDVAVRDDLVGIARTPIAPNALGSLAVAGVFRRHWASADGRTTRGKASG
jgi:predicted RecA/RadA family phage recombinase